VIIATPLEFQCPDPPLTKFSLLFPRPRLFFFPTQLASHITSCSRFPHPLRPIGHIDGGRFTSLFFLSLFLHLAQGFKLIPRFENDTPKTNGSALCAKLTVFFLRSASLKVIPPCGTAELGLMETPLLRAPGLEAFFVISSNPFPFPTSFFGDNTPLSCPRTHRDSYLFPSRTARRLAGEEGGLIYVAVLPPPLVVIFLAVSSLNFQPDFITSQTRCKKTLRNRCVRC